MFPQKTVPLMAGLLFTSVTSFANADDTAANTDTFTMGIAGQYAPRYSGSNHQFFQVLPVIQGRKGAFFVDSEKGLGYDLQADNGLYLEHSLGYSLGRSDRNSNWRDGANELKGMGNIKAAMNTALAVGWSIAPRVSIEGKAILPVTDSQGVEYQASFTLIPLQNEIDTIALQNTAMFGDRRYMQIHYGVSQNQSDRTGYQTFTPGGGLYGISTNLLWNHQIDTHWGTTLSAGYNWLNDDVANSPIVFRRNTFSFTGAITYTF